MGSNVSPYNGDILNFCPAKAFDFSRSFAVVVSGSSWNPCGHMLLNTGGHGGWYFHVAEIKGYPRFMNEIGYQKYLVENNKKEISRTFISLTHPQRSMLKLEEILSKKWNWWVIPNNCANFVEEILQAGGTNAGLWSNCPSRELFR